MDAEKYLNLKESLTVELKLAKDKVPDNVYESYSALANTLGGWIYLGIEEKKPHNRIVGVSNPANFIRDFTNTISNKSKVSANLLSSDDIKVVDLDGKKIIAIHVPQAPTRMKPIFIRGNPFESFRRVGKDGDIHIERNEILSLLNDASNTRFDMSPNSLNYGYDDLCPDTIEAYRRIYQSIYPGLTSAMDNATFLMRIGALKRLPSGEIVATNGALATFGYASIIRDVFPYYKVDFYDVSHTETRWNYRIDDGDISWSGNVFDFYLKVTSYLASVLPNAFKLRGFENVSGQDALEAAREGVCNAIFNCDFMRHGGIKIVYDSGILTIENSGRIIVGLEQALAGGDSHPRNEGIMLLFRVNKIGERSGLGVPRIFTIFQQQNFEEPILRESVDPNDATILVLPFHKKQANNQSLEQVVLSLFQEGEELDSVSIAIKTGVSRTLVNKALSKLLQRGVLESNGLRTNGRKYRLRKQLVSFD